MENYNLFTSDAALLDAVEANGGAWNNEHAELFGEILGRGETLERGDLANQYTPVLNTHDRFGNRIEFVEFHPAYPIIHQYACDIRPRTNRDRMIVACIRVLYI